MCLKNFTKACVAGQEERVRQGCQTDGQCPDHTGCVNLSEGLVSFSE